MGARPLANHAAPRSPARQRPVVEHARGWVWDGRAVGAEWQRRGKVALVAGRRWRVDLAHDRRGATRQQLFDSTLEHLGVDRARERREP